MKKLVRNMKLIEKDKHYLAILPFGDRALFYYQWGEKKRIDFLFIQIEW